jgi:hypothetical protein
MSCLWQRLGFFVSEKVSLEQQSHTLPDILNQLSHTVVSDLRMGYEIIFLIIILNSEVA